MKAADGNVSGSFLSFIELCVRCVTVNTMASRHLTFRLGEDAFKRLEAARRQTNQSRSELAKTLLDEGLRMGAHPGIVFRSGPAGRRPALGGGPDVWEVVRAFKADDQASGNTVERIAGLTDLTPAHMETALRYYAEYQSEIDAWIERVDHVAEEAEDRWRREQQLLAR